MTYKIRYTPKAQRVNFKAYKAFYRVVGDDIEVLRIIPSKRDFIKLLCGA